MEIIEFAGGNAVVGPWSFGGGTALMLQIDHRDSHDIDIFLDDPQVLGLLNPSLHSYRLALVPSDYHSDGTRALKIVFDNIGEIDFICCAPITQTPSQMTDVAGHLVAVESPGEILAKKIHYRGASFQPRDIFDLVAATRTVGVKEITDSLREIRGECAVAKRTIEKMKPEFASGIMRQLMNIRPVFQDIPDTGHHEVLKILKEALG